MNHSEAVEQMVAERYLLDELTPDAREAFEEHLFDCAECALDLRAGNRFVDEAKAQLPGILDKSAAGGAAPKSKPSPWLFWLRPAFAGPAFAVLAGVVVFQNVITFPALREAASQPRLVPLTQLRPATRGASHLVLKVDRAHGAALQIDRPVEPGLTSISDSIDLHDSHGKPIWTTTIASTGRDSEGNEQLSLIIPGARLSNGTYSLSVTSSGPQGERTPVEEYVFDIVMTN